MIHANHSPLALSAVVGSSVAETLSQLNRLAAYSSRLFYSPLLIRQPDGADTHIPRYFYHSSLSLEYSQCIALVGGLSQTDNRGSRILVDFLGQQVLCESLSSDYDYIVYPTCRPDLLPSYQQSRSASRYAGKEASLSEPDINSIEKVLQRDIRYLGFAGIVIIEEGQQRDQVIALVDGLNTNEPFLIGQALPGQLHDSYRQPKCRVSIRSESSKQRHGFLPNKADLGQTPFVVRLQLPINWSEMEASVLVGDLLRTWFFNYRSQIAYGIHL